MITIHFTEDDKFALHHERFHNPDPVVRQKMEVLYLKSCQVPHKEIMRLSRISGNTMRSYFLQYQEGGLNRLMENRRYRPQSELMNFKDELKEYFQRHPPTTATEAAAKIAELTGIQRKPTQVRQFLKKIGMKPRKIASIPANLDEEAQEAFKKKLLIQN